MEECVKCIEINKSFSKQIDFQLNYIKKLENEKQILSDRNKQLSGEVSKKQLIIDNCFGILENYDKIYTHLKCNNSYDKSDINFLVDNIARNNSLYQRNRHLSQELTQNSLTVSEDSITCIKSDINQISVENVGKNFSQKTVIEKNNEKVNESSNNTSLINNNKLNSVIINNNNQIYAIVGVFEKLPKSEFKTLNENKGKDYVDEILQRRDFLKNPEIFNQINDKSEKPIIIGNYKKKSQEEKKSIRRQLLKNKNLVKTKVGRHINLSVPHICIINGKPVKTSVVVGFECHYIGCDYRSILKCIVVNHINEKHLKLYPFECESCDKRFPNVGHLNSHKMIHHSYEQLKCDFNGCKFVAKHKKSLTAHQNNNHLKVRPKSHACDWPECERRFETPYKLKSHIESFHKHIKQFACTWPGCEAKFYRNPCLITHTRSHTGEKPLPCDWPECTQMFRSHSTLRVHKQMHEGVKPYSCPWNGCKANYLRNADLKRHIICHEKGKHMKCKCCVNRK